MPTPSRILEAQARVCGEILPQVLTSVMGGRVPADRKLAAMLRERPGIGARDRRLVSASVFAVLRWWSWLADQAPAGWVRLGAAAAGPGGAPPPPPEAWAAVLLGAHLLEPGPLPEIAAVWARAAGIPRSRLAAFVPDAPLTRRAAVAARVLHGPDAPPVFEPEALLPAWALRRLETKARLTDLVEWLQRRPPVWLRAQTEHVEELLRDLRDAGIEVVVEPKLPGALRIVESTVNLRLLPAYRKGQFEIQDISSQAISAVCSPAAGQRWWDACAGGGGKALHLAQLMQRRGTVVATDKRIHKFEDLHRRARRAGFPNIQCREWHGQPLPRRRATFDGVLVDAPCSGSGTWRRNPDGRWRLAETDLPELVRLQTRLLHSAATGVRPGGFLVYATCSMFAEENQGVVESFLRETPEFEAVPFQHPLVAATTCPGTCQIWPWDADGDAMFVARCRRRVFRHESEGTGAPAAAKLVEPAVACKALNGMQIDRCRGV